MHDDESACAARFEVLRKMIEATDRRLSDYIANHQREEDRFAETVTARFEGHNQFIAAAERREALNQAQQGQYIQREYYEVAYRELERRIGPLESLKANIEGRIAMVGSIIGAVITLLTIGIQIVLHYVR